MNPIKIEKTVTTGMVRENSFGIINTEENVELHIIIRIRNEERGSFEMYDEETGGENWYAEGGLWFRGKELIDYDGVFDLSSYIKDELEGLGYSVSM